MTFKEKYDQAKTWDEKVLVMQIFHLAMLHRNRYWTVKQTAEQFECSIGLASENLKLANLIHSDPKILKCETRAQALNFARTR